jgi:hypothetical protein
MCLSFQQILGLCFGTLTSEVYGSLSEIYEEITKSNNIMTSSSNLLLLNVEDILGFAQLKAGKFVKNVKKFNIKRAIDDIVSI